MRRTVVILLSVMMLCFCVSCSVVEDVTLITSQNSPDGDFVVSLYQVGSPQWSFGPVDAKLVLTDSEGQKIDEVNLGLANDGTDVRVDNIVKIIWSGDHVEVQMREFDTAKQYTYILNYSE